MAEPKDDSADSVSKKLSELEESVGRIKGEYAEFGQYMQMLKDISTRYFRLMDLYAKHGKISVDLAVPEVKDPISQEIVRILLEKSDKKKPGSNLSEITRALKESRGSASRRIVREKVGSLEKLGVVKKTVSGRQSTYALSDALIDRWYDLLGLKK